MKSKIKNILRCYKCCFVWKNTDSKTRTVCPNCGHILDTRNRKEYNKQYNLKHPEGFDKFLKKYKNNRELCLERQKKWRDRLREEVLLLVGGKNYKCENCGCDDKRLLEINHINGGGNKELQKGKKSMRFYLSIARKQRKTNDLNILCKVCNALYYLEKKYGKTKHKIIYQ